MAKPRKEAHRSYKLRKSEENWLIESAIAEILCANAGFGSAEVAESNLRCALNLKPNREEKMEAHSLLAQICAQTKRHGEAMEHFRAALMVSPVDAVPVTVGLAEMFEKQKKWVKAIEVYTQGLAYANDAALHNGLAYCLAKKRRLKEAEQHDRRATELAPDNAAYANDLGYNLLLQGRLQEAHDLFEQALRLDPSDEQIQGNLRLCSQKLKRQ